MTATWSGPSVGIGVGPAGEGISVGSGEAPAGGIVGADVGGTPDGKGLGCTRKTGPRLPVGAGVGVGGGGGVADGGVGVGSVGTRIGAPCPGRENGSGVTPGEAVGDGDAEGDDAGDSTGAALGSACAMLHAESATDAAEALVRCAARAGRSETVVKTTASSRETNRTYRSSM